MGTVIKSTASRTLVLREVGVANDTKAKQSVLLIVKTDLINTKVWKTLSIHMRIYSLTIH